MKIEPIKIQTSRFIPKSIKNPVSNPVKPEGFLVKSLSALAAAGIAGAAFVDSSSANLTKIEKNLLNLGYQKDENGNLRKVFSPKEEQIFE